MDHHHEQDTAERPSLDSSLESYQKERTPVDKELPPAYISKDEIIPHDDNDDDAGPPSNSYVLGIAFYSFLGFTILQLVFALKANSSAMLADSEAMFVDAGTYLFNWLAEHLKQSSLLGNDNNKIDDQTAMLERRKLQRLCLELIPPLISVITLLAVTFITLQQSFQVLLIGTDDHDDSSSPDLNIMLFFSGLNLLLDVVNVLFFAKANHAVFSWDSTTIQGDQLEKAEADEKSPLLTKNGHTTTLLSITSETFQSTTVLEEGDQNDTGNDDDDYNDTTSLTGTLSSQNGMNLNMCSAWTHVFADTLRSVAVLVAASIAHFTSLLTAATSDAFAAVIVSSIILLSCLPLLGGLIHTAREIHATLMQQRRRKRRQAEEAAMLVVEV